MILVGAFQSRNFSSVRSAINKMQILNGASVKECNFDRVGGENDRGTINLPTVHFIILYYQWLHSHKVSVGPAGQIATYSVSSQGLCQQRCMKLSRYKTGAGPIPYRIHGLIIRIPFSISIILYQMHFETYNFNKIFVSFILGLTVR